MTPAIRPVASEDWEGWRRLWQGYLSFYDADLPESQYRLQFARLTDPGERRVCGLVAEDNDEGLIGLAHCIWHLHGWTAAPVLYLQDLFTAPEARGNGVARALMSAVYALGDRHEAAGIYWLTQGGNTVARALYDRVGRATDFFKYVRDA
ncbi:MAG: GNAT family N-acetyltransferase [Pseudomonadota bacterium]